jgi:hypothetical protein
MGVEGDKKLRPSRTRWAFVALLLLAAASVAFYLLTNDWSEYTQRPAEDCTNGVDDDGDQAVDCMDLDCLRDPGCRRVPGRGRDVEPPPPGDSTPSRNDAAVSEGPSPDGGGDDGGRYCTADSGVCVWSCESDSDCTIAIDFMSCCGGHPHEDDAGDTVVCPSAVHRARLDEDPCVVTYVSGMSPPQVPGRCRPICSGLVCGPCREASRAICRGSECVGVPAGACVDDDECPEGGTCVDPDGDGAGTCTAGTHECTTDAECVAAHSACTGGCACVDSDVDGLRDCACAGCPDGRCTIDSHCGPHHFCIDRVCSFAGDDACRMTMWDCDQGFICEPDSDNPSRGRCIASHAPDRPR